LKQAEDETAKRIATNNELQYKKTEAIRLEEKIAKLEE
jgi:hypothetical protein